MHRRRGGSAVSPAARTHAEVPVFDIHLRKQNELAFHALALDEQRKTFEPTFWTWTIDKHAPESPDRPLSQVEQRWFVGAHANVGGG